jgi:hypothetical protein
MARVAQLLQDTGATDFITLKDYRNRTSGQMIDITTSEGVQARVPVAVTLRSPAPIDLSARGTTLLPLAAKANNVGSMLIDAPEARIARWAATIETLTSSSLTDEDVEAAAERLDEDLDDVITSVKQPHGFTFTLSGESTNIPLRLENAADERLRVMIRLTAGADKLTFPTNDIVIDLLPRALTDIRVPVSARANGTVRVSLDVLSPTGEMPLMETVTLHANVNRLTGLAQVITGAGLLILLTWWVRNMRRGRRASRSAAAKADHPVMNGSSADGASDAPEANPEVPTPSIAQIVDGAKLRPADPHPA